MSNKLMLYIALAALAVIFLVRFIVVSLKDDNKTPIPEKPQFEEVVMPEEITRIEEFEKEQKQERLANISQTKPEYISASFNELYQVEKTRENIENKPAAKRQAKVYKNANVRKKVSYGNNATRTNNNSVKTIQHGSTTYPHVSLSQVNQVHEQDPAINEIDASQKEKQVINNPFGTFKIEPKTSAGMVTVKRIDGNAMFSAVIYGDQKITDGGSVMLRNTEKIEALEYTIPGNSILYGEAKYSGNRVYVTISMVKTRNGNRKVNLTCYDNDFIQGIHYKDEIDKAVEKTEDNLAANILEEIRYSNIIKGGIRSVANGLKKTQKLSLYDGYVVYVKTGDIKNRFNKLR